MLLNNKCLKFHKKAFLSIPYAFHTQVCSSTENMDKIPCFGINLKHISFNSDICINGFYQFINSLTLLHEYAITDRTRRQKNNENQVTDFAQENPGCSHLAYVYMHIKRAWLESVGQSDVLDHFKIQTTRLKQTNRLNNTYPPQ